MASNPFKTTPIQVPNMSGHDLSHSNKLTTYVGTITPILTDFLIPGDKINLGVSGEVSLPPMAADFYGRIQGKIEAFFVPCRIIWSGWRNFLLSNSVVSSSEAAYTTGQSVFGQYSTSMPLLHVSSPGEYTQSVLGPNSLADYLGMKLNPSTSSVWATTFSFNILPFLAYHKIWEDWYRASLVQRPCFIPYSESVIDSNGSTVAVTPGQQHHAMFLPYYSGNTEVNTSSFGSSLNYFVPSTDTIAPPTGRCNEGNSVMVNTMLLCTHQRNWELDYFTSANLMPQAGTPSQLAFNVSDSSGSFTISSLRAANALQQWLERNNIGGYSYPDLIKAHYGILPSDATVDRAIYIGRLNFDIYTRGVYQTANNTIVSNTGNPFNTVSTKYGDTKGFGEGNLISGFQATEHGFLMVNFTIVPEPVYSSGTRRYLSYSGLEDIAFPLLQGVGEQPIYKFELWNDTGASASLDRTQIFGYTHRYQEYKHMIDEVHGLLSDGQSLESFALQRSFSSQLSQSPTVNDDFLRIPYTFLDQVSAVKANVSKYGAWCNFYFDYKKVSVLSDSIVPTLGDLKDVHTEYVQQGGRRL